MNDVEVAIIGAGPYGLSLAAHLRAAGVSFRQFGQLMNPWRTAMPQGMFLKSQGFASNLSDPPHFHLYFVARVHPRHIQLTVASRIEPEPYDNGPGAG